MSKGLAKLFNSGLSDKLSALNTPFDLKARVSTHNLEQRQLVDVERVQSWVTPVVNAPNGKSQMHEHPEAVTSSMFFLNSKVMSERMVEVQVPLEAIMYLLRKKESEAFAARSVMFEEPDVVRHVFDLTPDGVCAMEHDYRNRARDFKGFDYLRMGGIRVDMTYDLPQVD